MPAHGLPGDEVMKRSEILELVDYKEINKIGLSRELTVILTGMGTLSLFLFGMTFGELK